MKLELVNVYFKDVISGLIENKYDIIMAGLYLTPQRALLINLSEPEAYSQVNLLANNKHSNLTTTEQFNKKGTV